MEAVKDADALVLMTPWADYKELDFAAVKAATKIVRKTRNLQNEGTAKMKNEANKIADRVQAAFGDVNERARHAISDVPFEGIGHLTISIGVGLRSELEDSAALYERADQSLYRAKRDGRNRSMMWRPI